MVSQEPALYVTTAKRLKASLFCIWSLRSSSTYIFCFRHSRLTALYSDNPTRANSQNKIWKLGHNKTKMAHLIDYSLLINISFEKIEAVSLSKKPLQFSTNFCFVFRSMIMWSFTPDSYFIQTTTTSLIFKTSQRSGSRGQTEAGMETDRRSAPLNLRKRGTGLHAVVKAEEA